jgi:methionyl-tRNA formyltransferase
MHRLLFLGTSDFAVPSLRALAADGRFEIVGVVTQPDRPVGRHATITPPPIKIAAQELGIKEIRQPEKMKDEEAWLCEIGPTCDAFVVVSYGKILRPWVLELPKHGVVNVHGSLLPRWRGAAPIQAAIATGDAVSGVTIMQMDADLDHGPILATAETPIALDETGQSLHDRLATLGAELLPFTLTSFLNDSLEPEPQNHDLATHCSTLTRDDGKLDFSRSAEELERQIRAYNPWPGTWTSVDEKRVKIFRARVVPEGTPGAIACGKDALLPLEIQKEGGKRTQILR